MFDIRDPFMNYYELLDYCFNDYIREFGERKFEKIKYKIKTSNKVGRLIKKLDEIQAAPASDNLIWTVNEILYFTFAKGQTQVIACLFALERWNNEINKPNNMKFLSYAMLKDRVLKVILKKKSQFW